MFCVCYIGIFICRAVNEAGESEYTYEVIVYKPPTFEETTLNQTTIKTIATRDFTADCIVTGYPTPEVSTTINKCFEVVFKVSALILLD